MKLRLGLHATEGKHHTDDAAAKTNNDLNMFGHKINKVVLVVHINMCIYAICFFIQIGALPYLSKKLGLDPVVFGYLQTTFAVVQLAGGPLFGRFGDLYGGRAALTLAFSSAAVSYALMAVAVSPPILFLSRLPSLFMHAMQAGQMVVTDMSESSGRAAALGKLGLSYGVGMVIGPFVGGILTQRYGEAGAAAVACAGSLLSVATCLYFVPAHTKSSTEKSPGIPIGIFQSMFTVVAMEMFKLQPSENGYLMSYIGCIAMITQGLIIGHLLKKASEMSIIKIAAFILLWSYLLLAYVQTVFQLCVVLVPLCVGLTLLSVVISSALTHTVSDKDTGAMLGMNMAVNSLIRTMSPTVGGMMITTYGFPSIGYLGFFNNLLIAVYMLVRRVN